LARSGSQWARSTGFTGLVVRVKLCYQQAATIEERRHDCGLALLLLLAGTVGWLTTVDQGATARERALQDAVLTEGRLFTAVLDHGAAILG
jgi:hypothetical protein